MSINHGPTNRLRPSLDQIIPSSVASRLGTFVEVFRSALLVRPRWERRGWAFLAFFFVLSIAVIFTMPWHRADFDAYYMAAVRISAGDNPYSLEGSIWYVYRYSPAFACLLTPLAHLDVAWAGRIWLLVNWLTLFGCMWLSLFLVLGRRPWSTEASALVLITLGACSCYICHNLFDGQVSLLMTLTCLAWAACYRSGLNFAGGMLLAAGCFLKLNPILLIPYLVLRRDWHGLGGVIVASFLLLLLPLPWRGLAGTIALDTDWIRFALTTVSDFQTYRVGNQGVLGLLARVPQIGNGVILYSVDNLHILRKIYPAIVVAIASTVYCWILWDLKTKWKSLRDEQKHERENLHIIVLLLLMTLASSAAWRNNYVALLLPCLTLAQRAYLLWPGYKVSRVVLTLVGAAWIWPLLVLVIPLAWMWPSLSVETTVLDVLKGRVEDPEWHFGIWLLQGSHVWVALAVGTACVWTSQLSLQRNLPDA